MKASTARAWQTRDETVRNHAPSARRRVVITGMGAVTPLGAGVDSIWQRMLAGKSGIGRLSRFELVDLPISVAGEVRDFDCTSIVDRKERRHLDDFTLYALAAATEAVTDARLSLEPDVADNTGVVLGSGFGGLASFERNHETLMRRGPSRVGPFAIPAGMANAAAAYVAQRLGITGPNQTVMTACAAGAHALGTALRLIQQGDATLVLAGGAEAPICPSALAGFHAMGALSRCSDPARASRPFDAGRDGFVIAEGAGVLVLEELEHARARGVRIHAEVLGYGASADAYHVCAPCPDGAGALRAMHRALADAGVDAADVGYVNAHGTSTHYNDTVETRAIKALLGAHAYAVPVSATKSALGHMIGAGAAVESILTVKALAEGVLPPTLNRDTPDPECDLDYIAEGARTHRARIALKNAFGFGGNNACLVFGAWQDGCA